MIKSLLGASALALMAATPASAVVIFLQGSAPTAEGSNFRYSYSGNFSNGEGVRSGDKLVIFDFKGLAAGSLLTPSPSVVGTVENFSGLSSYGFTDDPTIANLVFTYTGPTMDLSNQSFGGLSALSTLRLPVLDGFSAITTATSGFATGTGVASQGGLGVPGGTVPEPASWALMLSGFGMAGAAIRRRRTHSTVVFA